MKTEAIPADKVPEELIIPALESIGDTPYPVVVEDGQVIAVICLYDSDAVAERVAEVLADR